MIRKVAVSVSVSIVIITITAITETDVINKTFFNTPF